MILLELGGATVICCLFDSSGFCIYSCCLKFKFKHNKFYHISYCICFFVEMFLKLHPLLLYALKHIRIYAMDK